MSFEIYDADIVITNPTHYAVAIKYYANKDSYPVVVTKGVDDVALFIKNEAQKYCVPVYENPPLAREICVRYDVGCEIDQEDIRKATYAALRAVRMGIYKVR